MNRLKQFISSWAYYTGALYIADVLFWYLFTPSNTYRGEWWSPLIGGFVVAFAEQAITVYNAWVGRNVSARSRTSRN